MNYPHNMKLSANGMKALKCLHLILAAVWFGSSVSLNLLRCLVGEPDAAGMYWMAQVLETIDLKILVPGVIGCLLTGLVYGRFTHWGFFRHRWLAVKWGLSLFIMLFGTFYTAPIIKETVTIGKALAEGSGDAARYWELVAAVTRGGVLQLTLLIAVMLISVYRPWKRIPNRNR